MIFSEAGKWNLFFAAGIATGALLICTLLKLKSRKKLLFTLKMLEGLRSSGVHVKDMERVEAVIRSMVAGGKNRLQVIADFDRTLSRYRKDDGTINNTCHNALENKHLMGQHFIDEAITLRDTYYAIEIDNSLSREEKYPFMVEWWTKAHNLLIESRVTKDTVKDIAAESLIALRVGTDWLFRELNAHRVPLLILSAGLGDVIEEVVKVQSILYDNIKVVSNYMDFNSQGVLVGFKGELIHTFNKNENAIHGSSYFSELSSRDNILLLGDSLGDLHMADGACGHSNLLKIGFLNDKVDTLLPIYKDAYDIVLVSDETFHVPNAIVKAILEN